MTKALEGVRIADFSHVMAGPFSSHFLKTLGADVIKVEAPGRGDPLRDYGPDRQYDGMSPAFIASNCGKESIILDLKKADGLAAAKRLIETSDIVLENFRPGVMARLGLGYEDACKLRKDIIYCSVSGYGQSGPMRDYPAIDNIVQATSGVLSLNGEPDDPYMRVGFPVVDTYTATLAAMSILGALYRRSQTGAGQHIDVAMFDSSMVMMAAASVPYLVTGKTLPRTGNTGYSGHPTAAIFPTSDGEQISLGVVQPAQFKRLAEALGRPDFLTDDRFSTPAARLENPEAIKEELVKEFKTRTGDEWEAYLSPLGVPCGMVRSVPQACELPQMHERDLIKSFPQVAMPGDAQLRALNAGYVCNEDGPDLTEPPPRHGQHTRQVLERLGYTAEQIDTMIENGSAHIERD